MSLLAEVGVNGSALDKINGRRMDIDYDEGKLHCGLSHCDRM